MHIHVQVHIRRNQRNEDADGKKRIGIFAGLCVRQQASFHRFLLNLQKKKKENKKTVRQNTKHAARATQVERQVEKTAHTHDTDSQKQANRQGMCVRETGAIFPNSIALGGRKFTSSIQCLQLCDHPFVRNIQVRGCVEFFYYEPS